MQKNNNVMLVLANITLTLQCCSLLSVYNIMPGRWCKARAGSSGGHSEAQWGDISRYQAEINSQPVTAAHSTPQKYLDDTKNISSIQHGTIDTDPAVMETILQGEYGPPLDYSFRNISTLSSLPSRWPRQSLRKQRRSPSGRLVIPCFYIICSLKHSPTMTSN